MEIPALSSLNLNFNNYDGSDIQSLLIIINFLVLFIIFLYAFYLYTVEKKIRAKYANLQNWVNHIISSANHKALEILTKSDYVSNSLRNEINENFEDILKNLRTESEDFYKSISDNYKQSSHAFVKKIEKEGEQEVNALGEKMAGIAGKLEEKFDQKLQADYEKAHLEIEEYKKKKMALFEAELREKVKSLSSEILPDFIPEEAQVRLVKHILEKASNDK